MSDTSALIRLLRGVEEDRRTMELLLHGDERNLQERLGTSRSATELHRTHLFNRFQPDIPHASLPIEPRPTRQDQMREYKRK